MQENSTREQSVCWHIYALTDTAGSKAALLSQIAAELVAGGDEVRLTVRPLTANGYILLAKQMLRQPLGTEHRAWYRFNWALGPIIALSAARVRFFGGKTVLQVPTPASVVHSELAESATCSRALAKRFMAEMMFVLAALVTNVVLQHGVAAKMGPQTICRKTIVLPNPATWRVGVERRRRSIGPAREVKFVGVSSNGHYHNFERLIRGIIEHRKQNPGYPFAVFEIIGPLSAFSSERGLVERCSIAQSLVRFHGRLSPAEVDDCLASADIAVGPLGAGPIRGLQSGSAIRHRTYMSVGVPFITDLPDVAIGASSVDWIRVIESNNQPVEVSPLIEWSLQLDEQRSQRDMRRVVSETSVTVYADRIKIALASR